MKVSRLLVAMPKSSSTFSHPRHRATALSVIILEFPRHSPKTFLIYSMLPPNPTTPSSILTPLLPTTLSFSVSRRVSETSRHNGRYVHCVKNEEFILISYNNRHSGTLLARFGLRELFLASTSVPSTLPLAWGEARRALRSQCSLHSFTMASYTCLSVTHQLPLCCSTCLSFVVVSTNDLWRRLLSTHDSL